MRNLNLPDHTPAPETLAFAHELEAANTAQTRRELLAEVTRLEAENATLRQQVDALTGERDAARKEIYDAQQTLAYYGSIHGPLNVQLDRLMMWYEDLGNKWSAACKWSALWKQSAKFWRLDAVDNS